MTTMTAFQLVEWGKPAEFRDVPVPEPGPGEVLIKVAGVGLCHSDLLFLDAPAGVIPYELPFTLGHESAGWVEVLGEGVDDLAPGDAVAVAGIASCGRCRYCLAGNDNYCPRGSTGRGYGEDGGLANYLLVPRRELVPLTTLDPRRVGPLTDAGATSYHAVKRVLPKLVPGTTAVVIGPGGLGSYAVQYLRRLSAARVIAIDIVEEQLAVARELGAHHAWLSDDTTAEQVRELTGGDGAMGVFDFVGIDSTMRLALACARTLGSVAFVGAGGGLAKVGWGAVPLECEVFVPLASTIGDLHEVVALAEAGEVRVEVEHFAFDQAPEAYAQFRRGELRSRAVVTPNG